MKTRYIKDPKFNMLRESNINISIFQFLNSILDSNMEKELLKYNPHAQITKKSIDIISNKQYFNFKIALWTTLLGNIDEDFKQLKSTYEEEKMLDYLFLKPTKNELNKKEISVVNLSHILNYIKNNQFYTQFLTHFYDGERGLSLNNKIVFMSALDRIQLIYPHMLKSYKRGDIIHAYYLLGRILHILQDLTVPAHVHNDPHGPTYILGKEDPYETFLSTKVSDKITTVELYLYLDKAHEKAFNLPYLRGQKDINLFVNKLVKYTQQFRTLDRQGTKEKKTGKLNYCELNEQASILIPFSIYVTKTFVEFTLKQFEKLDKDKKL